MAKSTLPVNFKDDILGTSMSGKRRYNLIQNSDGTVSLEDVTTYTQVGSAFGAAQVNATNTAVNESADKNKIIDDLDDIAANTKTGMIAGALAVKELNGNFEAHSTSASTTLSSTVYLYRVGNLVWLSHSGTFGLPSANVEHHIATIPSGYRPKNACREAEVSVTTGKSYAYGRWTVGTDGKVLITCSNSSVLEHCMTMCYFTDDELPTS